MLAQADAYGFIATLPAESEIGRESAKQAALVKYRELRSSDSGDPDVLPDVLMGIATFTENHAERTQLLRDVVRLKPGAISVNALVVALRQSGSKAALLEAGKVADDFQRISEGSTKWRFAAEALDLYGRAGEPERAADVQRRARQDVGAPAVLRELSGVRVSDPSRAAALLDSICDSLIAKTIGAQPCLDGLELTVSTLGRISDRQGAQRLADSVAGRMEELARESGSALEEADPVWYPRVIGLLDRIPAQGLDSATTWFATAMLDRTESGRTKALERAVSFAPDSPQLLSGLASAYLQQRRWDEAIAIYQRAREATPQNRADQRRDIERNLQLAEAMRAADQAPAR